MPIDGIVLEDIDITSKLGAEFIYSKNISMKNVNIRNTEGEKIVTRYLKEWRSNLISVYSLVRISETAPFQSKLIQSIGEVSPIFVSSNYI